MNFWKHFGTRSFFQKNIEKVWDIKNLKHSQIQKKSRQKWQSSALLCKKPSCTILIYRNQALRAWILEFEMSVHRLCKFDPFWTDLIQKDPNPNKMGFFILFKNVTTFYTNIFWYVQPLRSIFAERQTDRQTDKRKDAQTSKLK